jgi:hypothetical protein
MALLGHCPEMKEWEDEGYNERRKKWENAKGMNE